MIDSRILSVIQENRSLKRKFHNLALNQRRDVLKLADGNGDEKLLLRLIRKVKSSKKENNL